MAGEKVATIDKWLGVNYCPDGDVDLKVGEAAEMVNWKVTRSGNLKTRQGYSPYYIPLDNEKIVDVWQFKQSDGQVIDLVLIKHTQPYLTPIITYHLYNTHNKTNRDYWDVLCDTSAGESIGYHWQWRELLYFTYLTPTQAFMYATDTNTPAEVKSPYTPILYLSCLPAYGTGTNFEQVNKLTNKVRAWYTPDGTDEIFKVNTAGFKQITKVTNLVTNEDITSDVTISGNTVTFSVAPDEGVNTIEIEWELIEDGSDILRTLAGHELYSGNTDATLFFRNSNSDTIQHLGANYLGIIDPTYMPDYNVSRIGADADPVTGFMRHGTNLFVLKHSSAWRVDWGVSTDAEGNLSETFQVIPVNRNIGSSIDPIMVLNDPISVFGKEIYLWKNGSQYSSTLTFTETQANRISDRVSALIVNGVHWAVDDNYNQEAWFNIGANKFVIWNYALDVWYVYEFANYIDKIVTYYDKNPCLISDDGYVYFMSDSDFTDNGVLIKSRWVSGDMNFNSPYLRKFSSQLWVTYKQSGNLHLRIATFNDRKVEERSKEIDLKQFSFNGFSFANLSFAITREPKVKKFKLKNKKFTHMRVVLENDKINTSATVLIINIKYRESGDAK